MSMPTEGLASAKLPSMPTEGLASAKLPSMPHVKPGEVFDARVGSYTDGQTLALVKTEDFELIRMVLPAGKESRRTISPGPSSCTASRGGWR